MRRIFLATSMLLFVCGLYVGLCYLKHAEVMSEVSNPLIVSVLQLCKPHLFSMRGQNDIDAEEIVLDVRDQKIKALLERIYMGMSGFRVSKTEREAVCSNSKMRELTYGEITFDALQRIFYDLDLTGNDVFYDLGSGVGKSVLQAVLATPIRKAVGIELVPTRVALAQKAYAKIVDAHIIPDGKQVEFRQENIMDVVMDDATIVYMCATCYSLELMQDITDTLVALPQKNVQVISLKKLPKNNSFTLVKQYALPTSWSRNCKVYLYEKK